MSDTESYVYDSDSDEDYVYDGDGDGEGAAVAFPTTAPALLRQNSANIGTSGDVADAMDKMVTDTADIICIPKADCMLLLQHMKWDDQKLKGLYFDKEATVRNASITQAATQFPDQLFTDPKRSGSIRRKGSSPATSRCAVLTLDDDIAWSDCDALPCGHWMSKDGWRDFMDGSAQLGPGMVYQSCFSSGCNERVRPRMFKQYLSAEMYQKYRHYVLESFVSANPQCQWCPAPGCSFVSFYAGGGAKDIACKCGHEYCFSCIREAHKPCECDMVRRWEEKNSSESENTTWIMANTKPCPKCGVSIEKNQGCNHMTCSKSMGGCGHDFCWMCLGAWSAHGSGTGGYYSCNKYEKLKEKGKLSQLDQSASQAREKLDRYIHYFSRFDNHERARRHARQLLVKLEKKMDRLQSEKGLTYKDVECLKTAVEAILKGRRVLKWSYVFAYYCKDDQELALFEFLQQQLETNNEHLLELVELRTDVDKYLEGTSPEVYRLELFEFLREVRNYVSISTKFMDDVLSGVDNGLTQSAGGAAAGGSGVDSHK